MPQRLIIAALFTLLVPLTCGAVELEDPSAAVKVVDAKIVTTTESSQCKAGCVAVLGNLKNETDRSISDMTVEAKLLDAQGQMVDVLTNSLYGIVVMPGDQVAFRIQGSPAAPLASYAQVQARVTSGERSVPPKAAKSAKSEPSLFVTLLISWGPMLLLIAVWEFFLRRSVGKKSLMHEQIALIKQQLDLIAEQNVLFRQQVAALEKLAGITPPPDAYQPLDVSELKEEK